MTTVNTSKMAQVGNWGNTPNGNAVRLPFHLETNASGIATNTDLTTAIGSTDKIRLGIIPAGFYAEDCLATISVAFAGSTTCSLGFEYVDGVDVASPYAQDAAYFIAASQSLATAALVRKTGIKAPIHFPKDVYLILTMAGAAQTTTAVLDVAIIGTNLGA